MQLLCHQYKLKRVDMESDFCHFDFKNWIFKSSYCIIDQINAVLSSFQKLNLANQHNCIDLSQ